METIDPTRLPDDPAYLKGSSSTCVEPDRLEDLRRHIETPEMEVDRRAETLSIPKTAGGVLDPLDPRVDPLGTGVGDPVVNGVDHALEVGLDHSGDLLDRFESRPDGPAVPAHQGGASPNLGTVLPGGQAMLLERPGPRRLDGYPFQRGDLLPHSALSPDTARDAWSP